MNTDKDLIVEDDEMGETEYLLSSPKNKERLLQSVKNIKEGNVITRPLLDSDYEPSIDESVNKTVTNILKG